jgi:endonuclease YncB( thermonuclease family)
MFLNKRKAIFLISAVSLLFFLTFNHVSSQELKVVDGDTIHLNGEKIRFTGIDTPELKQTCINREIIDPCGVTAKEILIDKISDNKVECIREGKDQYKRTLAECFVNDESLSSYLVRSGYAFAYRRYSKKFVPDEDYARINTIGIWSMKFDYPWDYRKLKNK